MKEHISRLRSMIDPEQQTWDLSPNDTEAIGAILDSHTDLLAACKAVAENLEGRPGEAWKKLRDIVEAAIAKATQE